MNTVNITERDVANMLLDNEFKYIARDKNGDLFAYKLKPTKSFTHVDYWMKNNLDNENVFVISPSHLFSNVVWEDSEPYVLDSSKWM